jgi:hypothetical protein
VIVVDRHRHLAPVYLRVPREHSRHWNRYCSRYRACGRPVYFVRNEWYQDVYAPRYRKIRTREGRIGYWENGRGHRHDRRRNRGRGRHAFD